MFEFRLEATAGRRPRGHADPAPRTVATPGLHAGGHPRRGPRPQRRRRARGPAPRSSSGNTYHLHLRPGEGVVQAMGGLHRFTTWDAADAHRLRRLPGVLARGPAPHRRGRRRVPEPRGRHLPHAHARARHGDPVGPGRRHRDGVRPRGARPGAARAGLRGDGADAAVAGSVSGEAWSTGSGARRQATAAGIDAARHGHRPDPLAHRPGRHPRRPPAAARSRARSRAARGPGSRSAASRWASPSR